MGHTIEINGICMTVSPLLAFTHELERTPLGCQLSQQSERAETGSAAGESPASETP